MILKESPSRFQEVSFVQEKQTVEPYETIGSVSSEMQ